MRLRNPLMFNMADCDVCKDWTDLVANGAAADLLKCLLHVSENRRLEERKSCKCHRIGSGVVFWMLFWVVLGISGVWSRFVIDRPKRLWRHPHVGVAFGTCRGVLVLIARCVVLEWM